VKRFAQDDGFVEFEIQLIGYPENTKASKKSQALRMTILWEFDENNLNKLALMGLRPVFSAPIGPTASLG
jgi:hypothetical protein